MDGLFDILFRLGHTKLFSNSSLSNVQDFTSHAKVHRDEIIIALFKCSHCGYTLLEVSMYNVLALTLSAGHKVKNMITIE